MGPISGTGANADTASTSRLVHLALGRIEHMQQLWCCLLSQGQHFLQTHRYCVSNTALVGVVIQHNGCAWNHRHSIGIVMDHSTAFLGALPFL